MQAFDDEDADAAATDSSGKWALACATGSLLLAGLTRIGSTFAPLGARELSTAGAFFGVVFALAAIVLASRAPLARSGAIGLACAALVLHVLLIASLAPFETTAVVEGDESIEPTPEPAAPVRPEPAVVVAHPVDVPRSATITPIEKIPQAKPAEVVRVQAAPAPVAQPDELEAFAFEAPTPCNFADLAMPDGLMVYAAGGYAGREQSFQIDQSGHTATRFDVAVNSPGQPVALILGAYEPTVWNIGWTQGTEIVAVRVSGYHRQAIAGLESTVPVVNTSYEDHGRCDYFYLGGEDGANLNPTARKLFGKSIDMLFPGDRSGKLVIGKPIAPGTRLVTSGTSKPESFRDEKAPLAGKAGIDAALRAGILRPATEADADAWVAALAAITPVPDAPPIAGQRVYEPPRPSMTDAWVVLKQFTYPAGLYGAHAETFVLPAGVPRPLGDPGHSTVFDFNSLRCEGVVCRR